MNSPSQEQGADPVTRPPGFLRRLWQRYGQQSWVILAAILAVAFLLRFMAVDYGLPYLYDWDEPEIMQSSMQILRHGSYGPARSGRIGYGILNNLLHAGWGTLSYFRGVGTDRFPGGIWGLETERDTGYYWTIGSPFMWEQARILSVLLGCMTVFFIYRAGLNLGGQAVGLGAAALAATSSIHLASTARITPDAPALAALSICLYASTVIFRQRTTSAYLAAAASAALACGFKLNYVVAIVLPLAAHMLSASRFGWRTVTGKLAVTGLVFFCLTALFQIHAILYPTLFLHNYGTEAKAHIGSSGLMGYVKKLLVLFDAGSLSGASGFGRNLLFEFQATGLPLVVTALIGVWLMTRKARTELIFLLVYLSAVMIMVGSTLAFFFSRHLLPALPVIALMVGYGFHGIHQILKSDSSRRVSVLRRLPFPIIAVLIFLPVTAKSFHWSYAQHSVVDPRVAMSRDMVTKIPSGSSILILEETRWFVSAEEKKLFRIKKATIPQLLVRTPDPNIDYVIAPLSIEYKSDSPKAQRIKDLANAWLMKQKPTDVYPGSPSIMEEPPADLGVQLIPRAALVMETSSSLPHNLVWGTSLSPETESQIMYLAHGSLAIKSGQSAVGAITVSTSATKLIARAKGTSPLPQPEPPTVTIELISQRNVPVAKAIVALKRSQSGMNSYSQNVTVPPGKYFVRVVPSDADNRIVLVESIELE